MARLMLILICIGAIAYSGCYTLSGVSIDPAVYKTYYVMQFENSTDNAPPTLAQEASEALKEKIRTDSRLTLNDTQPDIEFKGRITDYSISFEAPRPGEFAALNRLRINISIEYTDNKDEKKSWKQSFQFFFDYATTIDLATIQQQAHQVILSQIMEDIFNKTFTDW
jgi:hypothetical protein